MAFIRKISVLPILLIVFASCTTVSHYEKIDEYLYDGDYEAGLDAVKAEEGEAYGEKDKVLYYLDAGMVAHYAGNYEESSKLLHEGELAIEAAYTKSITAGVSSYLVNDTMLEYAGEDYEDIYLNAFSALNYYHEGSIDDALVEIRRLDNKLQYLSTKYGTEITNAQQAVMEKSSDIPYDPGTASVTFSNSALGRYLGMLFYRSENQYDDARIDRDQIKLAFANQPTVYNFQLPDSLEEDLDVPKGKARLNIVSFNGLAPVKTAVVERIPLGNSRWIKLSLPVITPRPSEIARTEVVFDTGARVNLELIENMSTVASETFKQKAALIYLKTVLRSITKTSSSVAMSDASDRADSAEAALLLSALSVGTQLYAEASEQADLRISHYFPDKAFIGGITLDPGIYSYTIRYYDNSNRLVQENRFESVEIKANKLNLTEAICVK